MPLRYPSGWQEWEDDRRRAWISKKIAEMQDYIDQLKKESRKLVLGRSSTRVDPERPDLEHLKA